MLGFRFLGVDLEFGVSLRSGLWLKVGVVMVRVKVRVRVKG